MSALYGTVTGARGIATKCGTKSSGIRASVQSWEGSCISELMYNTKDQLILSISTANESTSGFGNRKYYGTIEQFNDLMDLVNKVGVDETIDLLNNYKK